MSLINNLNCPYYPSCRGCQSLDVLFESQLKNKETDLRQHLKDLWSDSQKIDVHNLGMKTERNRFDFTIEYNLGNLRMGLYDSQKKLVDIEVCQQLENSLNDFYKSFRQVFNQLALPLIKNSPQDEFKGSVRLRIGPQNQKGLWLDWPNIWIKKFIDHKLFLNELLAQDWFIEVGQKGKKLSLINSHLRLIEKLDQPQTFFRFNQVNLFCGVKSFSQPSIKGATKLVDLANSYLKVHQNEPAQLIEFGPGIGLFTKALATSNSHLKIYSFENDPTSLEYFNWNLKDELASGQVQVFEGDFQNIKQIEKVFSKINFPSIDHNQSQKLFSLVNPPRSGLKDFVKVLVHLNPELIIYVSCYPNSLVEDLQILSQNNYKIKNIQLVDQFPQTTHYETVALLQRINL